MQDILRKNAILITSQISTQRCHTFFFHLIHTRSHNPEPPFPYKPYETSFAAYHSIFRNYKALRYTLSNIITTTVFFITLLLLSIYFAFLTGFNQCQTSIPDFFMWESPHPPGLFPVPYSVHGKAKGKHETQSGVFTYFLSALPLPKCLTTEHWAHSRGFFISVLWQRI